MNTLDGPDLEGADEGSLTSVALKAAEALRLERRSTASLVSATLRDSIIRGELPPGTPLREHALAEALEVSRNTVRESLRLLTHEGLVSYHVHRGVTVKRLDESDVRDLYRTRAILEVAAIRCSDSAPREQLEAIAATVDHAETAASEEDFTRVGTLDIHFHQQIVALSGGVRVEEFFRRIVAELRLAFAIFDPRNHARFVPWNRTIASLLIAGELERCAEEMRDYLTAAEAMIVQHLHQTPTRPELTTTPTTKPDREHARSRAPG